MKVDFQVSRFGWTLIGKTMRSCLYKRYNFRREDRCAGLGMLSLRGLDVEGPVSSKIHNLEPIIIFMTNLMKFTKNVALRKP